MNDDRRYVVFREETTNGKIGYYILDRLINRKLKYLFSRKDIANKVANRLELEVKKKL